jgi:hypothetical protein
MASGREMRRRSVVLVAWSLWLATLADQAAGVHFLLSFATIGLVLALRRPANPIGWVYATGALVASLTVPWSPWFDQLIRTGRPLPWLPRL